MKSSRNVAYSVWGTLGKVRGKNEVEKVDKSVDKSVEKVDKFRGSF